MRRHAIALLAEGSFRIPFPLRPYSYYMLRSVSMEQIAWSFGPEMLGLARLTGHGA